MCDSYTEALDCGERSLAVAVTPQDQDIALGVRQPPWCCFGELTREQHCWKSNVIVLSRMAIFGI